MNILYATYRIILNPFKRLVFGNKKYLTFKSAVFILHNEWKKFFLNCLGYEVISYDISIDEFTWEFFDHRTECSESTKLLIEKGCQEKWGYIVRGHA